MPRIVVIGAGVAGLGTALALDGQGHHVTIVERDTVGVPDSADAAFAQWPRPGAPQARHSHAFLARLRNVLRDRAPDVLAELMDAGVTEVRFMEHPPPTMVGLRPEPGDEDLVALACRRTTFEWVLRRHVLARPGAVLVAGRVAGLSTSGEAGPVPRVSGVRLADGRHLAADLVVDAGGRRSPLPRWLAAVGAGPVDESSEDTGIVYSSRFYRLLPGVEAPDNRLVVADLGYLKYAVFAGDNRTFSVTFGLRAGETDLRRLLLRPGPFDAAAAALDPLRPWVDAGRSEPISGVEVMGGLLNRLRSFAPGGRPAATGVLAVGDASVCTNPVYGRGCSLAMVQAHILADVVATHPEGGEAAALAYDAATRREIEPWYRTSVAQDRADKAEAAAPGDGSPGLAAVLRDGLLPAARTDPLVYRAFIRAFNLLDPPGTLMANPEVVARVMTTWQDRASLPAAASDRGPDRADLLRLLGEDAA